MTEISFNGEIKNYKKIGLALSGGGFRASFFHLGVLARMAELDLLRHVNVISTVSGGSIIGALYYIKLFQNKPNTQEQYIELIQELEREFVNGVRANIRNKVFFHKFYEFKAVFEDREKLLGYFYNKFFYKDNYKMSDLQSAGMPELVINCALLSNGGHWYFKTNCMGQYSDPLIIDSKGKLAYSENSQVYLKDAVAGSSCVPGLFNYVKLNLQNTIYKFVDGGAFDNLGIFSLKMENCDFMIISDGSKQLTSQDYIPRKRFNVLRRSYDFSLELNKKLMLDRINCYEHIHLKESHKKVSPEIGEALSKIRTDLDMFEDDEWKSLSQFGYVLSEKLIRYASSQTSASFLFKEVSSIMQTSHSPKTFYLAKLQCGSDLNKVGGNMIFYAQNWKQRLDGVKEIWRNTRSIVFSYALMLMIAFLIIFTINHSFLKETSMITYLVFYLFCITGIITVYIALRVIANPFINIIDFIIVKLIHLITLLSIYLITVTFLILFIYSILT